ncbi:DUF2065 family protein [Luteimonas yindakuii]|uniref:DUF2065 family protein n=1 Tax=Luteimonas yindakuii TaxID=2565782 RepID=A0A4Z1R212_9GAMM|nr:DUF2065 domain-containing protein [Luteimonas yindakuii]QCO67345.1 DUF2065 domain-containing protein [Luteimonas yindakuii]TKS53560.1 DUF2065 family protein [Luteimonas yindakuii]
MSDLWAALCLVAVLEGLILFAMPGGWKRTMVQMLHLPDRQLRGLGGIVLATGLLALYFVRGG